MDLQKLFFFLKPVKDILIVPFGWVFLVVLIFYIPFLRPWWWFLMPLALAPELYTLYMWWINWDYNYAKRKWVILELIPPKEVLTPIKAMEDVFTVLWGPLYAPNNWREVHCEGGLPSADGWMSWEIASIEGQLHFYVRTLTAHRPTVETILYSHYPELEIREVPDYTRNVPQNVPNEEWDTYGEDFILAKPPQFPIKTYEKFFEPKGEAIQTEEKRIDPMASLLELMSKLGPSEQFWMQVTIHPVDANDEPNFLPGAKKLIDKFARRPVERSITFFEEFLAVIRHLFLGPTKEGESYKWVEPTVSEEADRELVITPGEREVIQEIENKIKKPIFRTNIRGVYVAKRENWHSSHKILTRSYFTHFQTENLNYLRFTTATRPKTQYVFRKRIPYLRARRQFRNYIRRFPPFFPERTREMVLLNPEELATIFHFPIKITGVVLPTMVRVESKKAGPPPNLPTE